MRRFIKPRRNRLSSCDYGVQPLCVLWADIAKASHWNPCNGEERRRGLRVGACIAPERIRQKTCIIDHTHAEAHAPKKTDLGLLTKCLFIYSERKKGSKKDAHRRHPMYFIILFKFKAVAERRQWSSAASKPRRKTRVKLCPHFWAANVPSHQTCRLRSASR